MKFSSAIAKLNLTQIEVAPCIEAHVGDVILAKVLTKNSAYPHIEDCNGELSRLAIGDLIVGTIGTRQALRGFVGYPPPSLKLHQSLSLLNMGGVMGCCTDTAVGLGAPPQVKYLGTVVDAKGVVNLNRVALPQTTKIKSYRPIILVLGTCMNVGKTSSAVNLIASATQAGFKVGAAKIAGVAALKDLKNFSNAGALDVKSFLDCGLPSTIDADDLAALTIDIVNALHGDLLIIELGDGIMGHYKVDMVLKNADIMSHVSSIIVCASDLAAAYGAKHYLQQFNIGVDVFSGPVTDNSSGSAYIEQQFGIAAINSMKFPQLLFEKSSALWRTAS